MDAIRYATPEEVDAIAANSDITPSTTVVSYGGKDLAVIRQCTEIDPMYFHADSKTVRRLMFAMNLETVLRLQGVREIYFNVPAHDKEYMKVLETWGAEPTSKEPEIRFKKVL